MSKALSKILAILVVGARTMSTASADEPLQEAAENTIGFPTVSAALEALSNKQGTTIRMQEGWTLIEDFTGDNVTLWSFTPPNHPAHPSAVKRALINQDDGTHLEMSIRCEAAKSECDQLVRDFQALNAEMIRAVKGERP